MSASIGVCIGGSASRGGLPSGGWADPPKPPTGGGWVAASGGGQTPPEIHGIVRDTVNKQAVRILLECFLVCNNTYLKEVTFSIESTGTS